jgi:hypothetical protein
VRELELHSSHLNDQRPKNLFAAMVLLAVCSLTVSLATRYSFPVDSSSRVVKSIKVHASPDTQRQRLDKKAANWVPPVFCLAGLQAPSFCPRIAPAAAPVTTLLLGDNLYNRPPPAFTSLT